MRIDRATIPLEPQKLAGSIDLAVMFCGRHLGPICRLVLVFAIPTCGLVYVLGDRYEFDLRVVLIVGYLVTGLMGVALMSGATRAAFGDPFTLKSVLGDMMGRMFGASMSVLFFRVLILIGPFLWIYPLHPGAVVLGILLTLGLSTWLPIRTGFLAEQASLSRLIGHVHDRKTAELIKLEFSDLLFRGIAVWFFCVALWLVAFLTIDVLSWLFSAPILLGRFVEMIQRFEFGDFAYDLFVADPLVMTTAMAITLAVYPIGRLAWFFCYIDLRVYRDLWDIELHFAQEATRLKNEMRVEN